MTNRTAFGAAAAALVALPATAGAEGTPTGFPRAIAITSTQQGIRVARLQVATRASGKANVRVSVRVKATSLKGTRTVVLAVAPCTAGPQTSPLCRPRFSARLRIATSGLDRTIAATVPRPAAKHDALRVTLTATGGPHVLGGVGGGAGSGEILLNGGTWRYRQGTRWGIVATPPAGLALDLVRFNSRTYAWTGTSAAETPVTSTIGYEGQAPRHRFANTMRAGVPYRFDHAPALPARDARTAPQTLEFAARTAAGAVFTVRMPVPVWPGG